MPTKVITPEDLQDFKREILKEVKNMMVIPPYLTYEGIFTYVIGHKINEKGEKVGLSQNTLYRWRKECGLEVTKVGNINLYNTESLMKMLKGKSMYRAYLKPD